MTEAPSISEEVVSELLAWGGPHLRDLPWRRTRDPWGVLVSEVMAQQTQVDRIIPRWEAFMERFPTPEALAEAPLADLLRLWQGLGYPRRARSLHEAARRIANSGRFPSTVEELMDLPGVGPYTARAVAAFAFDLDVGVLDTNVGRLLARLAGSGFALRRPSGWPMTSCRRGTPGFGTRLSWTSERPCAPRDRRVVITVQ